MIMIMQMRFLVTLANKMVVQDVVDPHFSGFDTLLEWLAAAYQRPPGMSQDSLRASVPGGWLCDFGGNAVEQSVIQTQQVRLLHSGH